MARQMARQGKYKAQSGLLLYNVLSAEYGHAHLITADYLLLWADTGEVGLRKNNYF